MTTNLKDKTALVWDCGLGMSHASRLGEDFGKVLYYTPYQSAFCKSKEYFLGRGFENTKKVLYYHDERKNADLFMFNDIGQGDLASELRNQGKTVFGGGDGEKFENHRFPFRMLQKTLGLPTQRTVECVGIEELERYLKSHSNQVVKVDNVFRGDCESFKAVNFDSIEQRINKLKVDFGPFLNSVRFMCEDVIETKVEAGLDGFFNGEWIRPSLWGFEVGACYLGTYSEVLPPLLEDCMRKLSAPLKKRNYRGAISTEQRIVNKDTGYLIDITCRFPYPLSQGYTKWIKNYSEVIWKVAKGEKVTLDPIAKYVGGVPITCENVDKWVKWNFPKELKEAGKISFSDCAKKDGSFWAIKGCNSTAFLIEWGNSPEDVIRGLKKTAEKVNSDDCNKTRIKELDDIAIEISRARSMGIKF